MTVAEIERYVESRKRVRKIEAQERASYDYIHADLVGRSIARIYSSSATYPDIHDVYPTIFGSKESEEKRQEQRDNASAIRFKLFAQSYNKRFKEVANDK